GLARARQVAALERLGNHLQDPPAGRSALHHHRHAPRRRPRAARRYRRRIDGVQRRPGLSAARLFGNLGQPETLRHGFSSRRHRPGQFQPDQALRTAHGAMAPGRGVVHRIAARPSLPKMNDRTDKLLSNALKAASILAGLLLWHVLAVYVVNDATFLVSPAVVVRTAYDMLFVTGELYPHLFASSWIFFYGFLLAILAGVPLGFVMALSPVVRDYVNPWMATLYTTPRIAF